MTDRHREMEGVAGVGSTRDMSRQYADEHQRSAEVELHIEELVLTGFQPGDRFRIGDAVEHELARLLGERGMHGLGRDSISVENLDAGRFRVAPGAPAQTVGGQIAQKVYGKIAPATPAASGKAPAGTTRSR